ncbi:membrane-spanning 4-domains subfamily A member 4A [Enoplosus armatus]|uniref:membrane-spanning 4-domains subfamily A member 4A n=1 Tax=Enoplosus armatus TaxID=215367 RepID=UPI0039923341
MKKTFVCDDTMIITIPIGNLRDAREGRLMPEKFQCVFKDSYKVFVIKGKPKPLGAAQAITGVFIVTLGLIFPKTFAREITWIYTLPSVLYVVSGMLSYAAGTYPNMRVTKLSFSLNIISFFWSVVAICICGLTFHYPLFMWNNFQIYEGMKGLVITLLVIEKFIALYLICWSSKAVCRQHFNTLPIILLKQGD